MPEERDGLLTLREVAGLLQCSREQLYRIPYLRARMVRLGKRSTRIPRSAVTLFIALKGQAA